MQPNVDHALAGAKDASELFPIYICPICFTLHWKLIQDSFCSALKWCLIRFLNRFESSHKVLSKAFTLSTNLSKVFTLSSVSLLEAMVGTDGSPVEPSLFLQVKLMTLSFDRSKWVLSQCHLCAKFPCSSVKIATANAVEHRDCTEHICCDKSLITMYMKMKKKLPSTKSCHKQQQVSGSLAKISQNWRYMEWLMDWELPILQCQFAKNWFKL